jgi:hypothetical protein
MEKLVSIPQKELPEWHEKFENGVPPNWREVTQEDFVMSSFFSHGFSHCAYRQFKDNVTGWFSGRLFFISGRPEGVAIDNQWKDGKYHIRFFRFAICVHTFEEVGRSRMAELAKKFPKLNGRGTWGNCCHNEVCTKCGDYRFTDSSD